MRWGDAAYRVNIAMRVQDIKVFETGGTLSMKIGCVEDIYGGECIYLAGEIGGMVFLTREDAETALKGEDEE